MKPRFFNMIEILLALFVIAIGISGIMGLLPVGFKMAGNARAENYASFAADQFMTMIRYQAGKSWSGLLTMVNTTKPTSEAGSEGTAIIPNVIPIGSGGVFKYVQKTGNIEDFSAYARVWRQPVNVSYMPSTGSTPVAYNDTTYANSAIFLIEISWPGHKAYALREKRTFSFVATK